MCGFAAIGKADGLAVADAKPYAFEMADRSAKADRDGADPRLFTEAAQRNRQPILDVLRRVLPPRGLVLEIASGSGEHAVHFARYLPGLDWQPSDPQAACRRSIAAHAAACGCANLRPVLDLDVTAPVWPVDAADAVVCINMIHIAPWSAGAAMLAGAARVLATGGILYLYGPFKRDGRHTAPTNEAFDASLRHRNPDWGVRNLEEVTAVAVHVGLSHGQTVEMPANNLSLVYLKA